MLTISRFLKWWFNFWIRIDTERILVIPPKEMPTKLNLPCSPFFTVGTPCFYYGTEFDARIPEIIENMRERWHSWLLLTMVMIRPMPERTTLVVVHLGFWVKPSKGNGHLPVGHFADISANPSLTTSVSTRPWLVKASGQIGMLQESEENPLYFADNHNRMCPACHHLGSGQSFSIGRKKSTFLFLHLPIGFLQQQLMS